MSSRLSGWLGKLLLAAGSLALTLISVEVALRLAEAGAQGKEQDERATYMQPDPYLGWSKRPGARITYRRREYTTEVVINTKGLRDRERPYARTAGIPRVLALGDSYIEAYSVPFESTVTSRLEVRLRAAGCPAEVVNGGTTGYSTDQEYLFYVTEGWRYAPDVVIVFFHYNDLPNNVSERYYRLPKPLLDVSDTAIRQVNFPVPPPPPTPPRGPRRAPSGSRAWFFVQERLMLGAPATFNALARLGLWDPLGGDTPSDELSAYERKRSQQMQHAWRVTDRILAGMAREVSGRGGRLLVAHVPARLEVSDRDWYLSLRRYDIAEGRWDRRAVWNRLARSGEAGGFDVLDLTDGLRAADAFLRPAYYPRDGHWTERGHRAAADAVFAFLQGRHWLRGCGGGASPAAATVDGAAR
jgi:hypothetical protein